jgi:hypothetical protein
MKDKNGTLELRIAELETTISEIEKLLPDSSRLWVHKIRKLIQGAKNEKIKTKVQKV